RPVRRAPFAVMGDAHSRFPIQRLAGSNVGDRQAALGGQFFCQPALARAGAAENQFMHGWPRSRQRRQGKRGRFATAGGWRGIAWAVLRRACPHDVDVDDRRGRTPGTDAQRIRPISARRTALECDRPVFGLVSWNRYSESRAFPCRSTVACCDFPSPTVAGAAPELLRESVRTGFPVSPPKAGAPEAGAQVRPVTGGGQLPREP